MFGSKEPPQKWHLGDFVRVKAEGTTDVPLDNHGRLGVIIKQIPPDTRSDSAAFGMGWYHHIWFGPFQKPGYQSLDQRMNWRGCYDVWLEDA